MFSPRGGTRLPNYRHWMRSLEIPNYWPKCRLRGGRRCSCSRSRPCCSSSDRTDRHSRRCPSCHRIKSCPEILFCGLDPPAYDLTYFIDVRTPDFIPMDIDITQRIALANQTAQVFHFNIHILQTGLLVKAFGAPDCLLD